MNSKIDIQHYTVDFDESNAIVVAALYDNVFAGSCHCGIGKNIMSVYNFSVHPDYRGKGVAQKMLNYLIDCGRLAKKQSVTTVVFKDNAAAYGCYYKAGFRIVKEENDTYLMGYQL